MIILAITGHRPQKLGGFDPDNAQRQGVRKAIRRALRTIQPDKVITGMALGVDQDVAEICIELGIPFIAAVPFLGQEKKWNERSQEHYRELLSQAEKVEVVHDGDYAAWKLLKRNEWMIDRANVLLAVWDGKPDGGTAHAVKYAATKKIKQVRINPEEVLPVSIQKEVAKILYAMMDDAAPDDMEDIEKAFAGLDSDLRAEWLERSSSLIQQLNISGVYLLDREDVDELAGLAQRLQSQKEST